VDVAMLVVVVQQLLQLAADAEQLWPATAVLQRPSRVKFGFQTLLRRTSLAL
jgi:hypothetical protein